ncbi:MAG: [FeFe] hydrogenase H-cluster radical SAM maturase HydE [Alphaproteobacteria bacterium]|nr:[FeFe] hydrogenase H-cluster radical SAM maturase HydE [Alphaproteobacteria bacterium]
MSFSCREIEELLDGRDDAWLYEKAYAVRKEHYGNEVFLRGIIENSNHCQNNCLYCGLRADNRQARRYRLDIPDIAAAVREIDAAGIKSIVLQGGQEDTPENIGLLCKAVRLIKEMTNADITMSHGDFSDEVYARFRDAGADRYLLKVETMDDTLHAAVRPGQSAQKRIERLESLLSLGFQAGSGFIAGMPGYTNKMLAADMKRLSQMGLHMFSLTPFVPAAGTLWADEKSPSPDLVHRACAIYRLMDPMVNMPVTSAMESLQPGSKKQGLQRGCNVVMHSFTPLKVRGDYSIYKGKNIAGDEASGQLQALKDMVQSIGQFITAGAPGRSRKETHAGHP